MKKMMLMFAAAVMAAVQSWALNVTQVTVKQRFPWNGLVDIEVALSGNDAELKACKFAFAATNCATKAALTVATINNVTDDSVNTRRHFVWDARQDVGKVKIDDVAFMVEVTIPSVQLWEGGPYWAECNVGATNPEETGFYFWWGDTVGYERVDGQWNSIDGNVANFSFSEGGCLTYGLDNAKLKSKGYTTSSGVLTDKYDAAKQHFCERWRIPTKAEVQSLMDNCLWTWMASNNVNGYKVTGKGQYANLSIFVPAGGTGSGVNHTNVGSGGSFWSSTSDSSDANKAYSLYFTVNRPTMLDNSRYYGRPVRAVSASAKDNAVMVGNFSLNLRDTPQEVCDAVQLTVDPVWGEVSSGSVTCNGAEVAAVNAAGTIEWTPPEDVNERTEWTLRFVAGTVDYSVTMYQEPKFKIVSVCARQSSTGNGFVDIEIELAGRATELNTCGFDFSATDTATQTALAVATINEVDDTEVKTRRHFVWNAKQDVGAVQIADIVLTVGAKLPGGVQLWEGGPCWSECNVGATKPEEVGYYFWWGDTVGYKRVDQRWQAVDGSNDNFSFALGGCPTNQKTVDQLRTFGYVDNSGNLVSRYDAATKHLGQKWRMPTADEITALLDNCTFSRITQNGVYGLLVTGKEACSSRQIFIPVSGDGSAENLIGEVHLYGENAKGLYWTSTPHLGNNLRAQYLYFGSDELGLEKSYYRGHGFPIRPVSESVGNDGIMDNSVTAVAHLAVDAREVTRTTEVPVPYSWLESYFGTMDEAGYEAKAKETAANGVNTVEEAYVIGFDPRDAGKRFVAGIEMDADGEVTVTWDPDLNEGGTKRERVYRVWGRETLEEGDWVDVTEGMKDEGEGTRDEGQGMRGKMRFFKVTVEMP